MLHTRLNKTTQQQVNTEAVTFRQPIFGYDTEAKIVEIIDYPPT